MYLTIADSDIRQMSVEERLTLIERLWDSLLREIPEEDITEESRREVTRRWDASKANPADVLTWEEGKAQMSVLR